MSRLPPVPDWAPALAARACAREGTAPPEILWGRVRRRGHPMRLQGGVASYAVNDGHLSHGQLQRAGGRRVIKVWAGVDERDARLVFLHELAHWIAGDAHAPAFWDCAWRLYRRYLSAHLDFALAREAPYRVEAIKAASRAGVPGAARMLEERAAARTRARRGRRAAVGRA